MQHRFEPGFKKVGSTNPKFLFAGDFPVVTRNITVKAGQKLSYGSVMGRVTADGKYVLCSKGAGDGSQDPQGILTENIDATDGDKTAVIYLSGQFNGNYMTAGGSYVTNGVITEELRDQLRKLSIFTENGIKAFPRS